MNKKPKKPLICADCGRTAERRGQFQRYCRDCSQKRDRKRKLEWQRKHGRPQDPEAAKRRRERKVSAARKYGARLSKRNSQCIGWDSSEVVDLLWLVRFRFPFSFRMSKNAIWRQDDDGHVLSREKQNALRDKLVARMREALRSVTVVEAKIWIDVFVEKPNHKGDAINVIHFICDALKEAAGVDDRWISIKRLDWSIVKTEPQVTIGIGQDADEHHRACAYCGRILPLADFHKNTGGRHNKGRECPRCKRAGDRDYKQKMAKKKRSKQRTISF